MASTQPENFELVMAKSTLHHSPFLSISLHFSPSLHFSTSFRISLVISLYFSLYCHSIFFKRWDSGGCSPRLNLPFLPGTTSPRHYSLHHSHFNQPPSQGLPHSQLLLLFLFSSFLLSFFVNPDSGGSLQVNSFTLIHPHSSSSPPPILPPPKNPPLLPNPQCSSSGSLLLLLLFIRNQEQAGSYPGRGNWRTKGGRFPRESLIWAGTREVNQQRDVRSRVRLSSHERQNHHDHQQGHHRGTSCHSR